MNKLKKSVLEAHAYAWDYPAWIVTEYDGGLHYITAYDTVEQAEKVCAKLNSGTSRYKSIVIVD